MIKWYYRSVFDELEDMRNYMESLNRQVYGTNRVALLPGTGESAIKMLPVQRTTFPVEVSEKADEVVVTAGMINGTTKNDITLHLVNPQVLEIVCERKEEMAGVIEGHYLRERTSGSFTHIVPLPKPVTDAGSSAMFTNGVLEVHLKKTRKESGGKISID